MPAWTGHVVDRQGQRSHNTMRKADGMVNLRWSSGGVETPAVLLLRGLGATGEVWNGLARRHLRVAGLDGLVDPGDPALDAAVNAHVEDPAALLALVRNYVDGY
jgi:hypothetical protein